MTDPTPALHWQLLSWDALSRDEVYELLQLRSAVFVVEQHCPYLDLDGKDRVAGVRHLLGRDGGGALLAYLRLLPPGVSFADASFGRVVTSPAARGRGLGDALVAEALRHAARLWPGVALTIGAQAHLAGYYAKHGFVAFGEPYDEDGIPHVHMRREAAARG
jgi:ElaA protein